jgi:hypothetical protein
MAMTTQFLIDDGDTESSAMAGRFSDNVRKL